MVGENFPSPQCPSVESDKDVLTCVPSDVGRDGNAEGSVALALEGCSVGESAQDIGLDS